MLPQHVTSPAQACKDALHLLKTPAATTSLAISAQLAVRTISCPAATSLVFVRVVSLVFCANLTSMSATLVNAWMEFVRIRSAHILVIATLVTLEICVMLILTIVWSSLAWTVVCVLIPLIHSRATVLMVGLAVCVMYVLWRDVQSVWLASTQHWTVIVAKMGTPLW